MKRIIVFICGFMLLFVTTVSAHPIREMNLTYDLDAKNLHIEIVHISREPTEKFIRKVIVYKNNKEITQLRFTKQDNPYGIVKDFSLQAEEGDTISIKAFSSQGGSRKTSIEVVKNSEDDMPTQKASRSKVMSGKKTSPKGSGY